MAPGPPTWRVFDAPPDPGTSGSEAGVAAPDLASSAAAEGAAPRPSVLGVAVRADVIVGLVAAVGGLVLAWLLATGGPGGAVVTVDGGTPMTGSGEPGPIGALDEVVVDVVGAVLRPGVYHLPQGSRVGDAITAAGGFGPRVAAERADLELNLAAVVHDGEQIVVPSRDDPATTTPGKTSSSAPGGRIDLNTASEEELDSLPGIGPVTAGKIVASRATQPFRSVDELLQRKLVGQKTFDSIKALVTVG